MQLKENQPFLAHWIRGFYIVYVKDIRLPYQLSISAMYQVVQRLDFMIHLHWDGPNGRLVYFQLGLVRSIESIFGWFMIEIFIDIYLGRNVTKSSG